MKKVVWENKSNGQLCVTIPKNSGIKSGEIVSIEKEKVKTIVYSSTTGDLFNYGQLKLLEEADKLGDFHISGVLTDEAIKSYKEIPIANLKERMAIISGLRCVDMVIPQHDLDPTENLKEIHNRFKGSKIILVYGSNWKKIPGGKEFIKKINGKIIQPISYERLSPEKMTRKITKLYSKTKK
tara:strand:- start:49240 stop:49785 length:546 start_codon:yes stop_codon:yes gene_type:complete